MKLLQVFTLFISFKSLQGSKLENNSGTDSPIGYSKTHAFVNKFFESVSALDIIQEVTGDPQERILLLTLTRRLKRLISSGADEHYRHSQGILNIMEICYRKCHLITKREDVAIVFFIHFCHILYSDTIETDTSTPISYIIDKNMLYEPCRKGIEALYAVPLSSQRLRSCIKLRISNFLSRAPKLLKKNEREYWNISEAIELLSFLEINTEDSLHDIDISAKSVSSMIISRLCGKNNVIPVLLSDMSKNYKSEEAVDRANTNESQKNAVQKDTQMSKSTNTGYIRVNLVNNVVDKNTEKIKDEGNRIVTDSNSSKIMIKFEKQDNTCDDTAVKDVEFIASAQDTLLDESIYAFSFRITNKQKIIDNHEEDSTLPFTFPLNGVLNFKISYISSFLCIQEMLEYLQSFCKLDLLINYEVSKDFIRLSFVTMPDNINWKPEDSTPSIELDRDYDLAKNLSDDIMSLHQLSENDFGFVIEMLLNAKNNINFASELGDADSAEVSIYLCCFGKANPRYTMNPTLIDLQEGSNEQKFLRIIKSYCKKIDCSTFNERFITKYADYNKFFSFDLLTIFSMQNINIIFCMALSDVSVGLNVTFEDLQRIFELFKTSNETKVVELSNFFECKQHLDILYEKVCARCPHSKHLSSYFIISYYFECFNLVKFTDKDFVALTLYQSKAVFQKLLNENKTENLELFNKTMDAFKERFYYNHMLFELLKLKFESCIVCILYDMLESNTQV